MSTLGIDDGPGIVMPCPKCSRVIWANAPCPACDKTKPPPPPEIGGPVVDPPAKVIGHYRPKNRDRRH